MADFMDFARQIADVLGDYDSPRHVPRVVGPPPENGSLANARAVHREMEAVRDAGFPDEILEGAMAVIRNDPDTMTRLRSLQRTGETEDEAVRDLALTHLTMLVVARRRMQRER